jgi:hypothetical protein
MARNRPKNPNRVSEETPRSDQDRTPDATEPKPAAKPKTWVEHHGGSLLIAAAFGMLVLMVVIQKL